MFSARTWLTQVILALGVALRLGLALATPPQRAYDDHYEPVRILLTRHELPYATDCWECYQPPLYYLVTAATTRAVELISGTDMAAREAIARRTLQMVSVAAGAATLYVAWRVFKTFPRLVAYEPLGLALLAFLPQHIYLSAMATNDAFTHLVAACAIWAALHGHARGWPIGACVLTGALAGATVLSKAYGWVTVAAVVLVMWWFTRRETGRLLRRPWLVTLGAALAVGIWPMVRNLHTYGELQVDNFETRDSPLRFQPPGTVGNVEFLSLRLVELMRRPWVHVAHANSFWTELYGRMWFDYEGFNTTLAPHPPWGDLWARCAEAYPIWERARWDMLLSYREDEVPPRFARLARVSYAAGLPLTAAVLAGAVIFVRRERDFAGRLMLVHFVAALAVPLVQTLRLPHFASMKSGFALGGAASAAMFLAAVPAALGARALRRVCATLLWLAVLTIGVCDALFTCWQWRQDWPAP